MQAISGSGSDERAAARRRLFLLAAYTLAILCLTLAPLPVQNDLERVLPRLDKVVHGAMFAGLAIMLYWNLASGGQRLAMIAASILLSVVAAAMIELIQEQLPYRSGDGIDFLAGALGALLAGALFGAIYTRRGINR